MDTLTTLQKRIDFCGVIVAQNCNPNGDPINSGAPRQDFSGHGIISDVCLKRKIRNRLAENGYDIFVSTHADLAEAGLKSLHARVKADPSLEESLKAKNGKQLLRDACEKWIDVRAFGQLFPFKGEDGGVSISCRGPVTIQDATSLDSINIWDKWMTKSVNTNDPKGKSEFASDIMGARYQIDHGAYIFYGSIYPGLAAKTGFSYEDALAVKGAIITMFQNDASSARPAGSMFLDKLYWWEHNCFNGMYSPHKVHSSVKFTPVVSPPFYRAELTNLPGLEPEIMDGW